MVALEADWPQWRGPDRDGRVVDPGLGPWLAGDFEPRTVWKTRLGPGFSGLSVMASMPATPSVTASVTASGVSPPSTSDPVGDRAFTTWADGDREVLGALDAHRGKVLWTVELGEVKGSAHGDGPRSTPLVAPDGVVYAMGSFGDLVAVRAADGEELWRRDLRTLAAGDEPDWGFSASPLLLGGRLVVHLGGPAAVLALDAATGDTLWQIEAPFGYASPRVAEIAGRRLLLSLTGGGLLGVDPRSGEVLWSAPRDTYYGLNAADPVPLGADLVFLSAHYNSGAALLRIAPPAEGDDEAWSVEEVWTSRRMRNHFATSHPWPEHDLVVGFDGEFLAALDAATGELLWKARGTGKGQALRVEPAGDGPPRLLVLSDECEVQLGTVDREGFHVEARHPLDLDGTCFAVPSLAGRRLFARDDRHAVAVDLADSDLADSDPADSDPADSDPADSDPADEEDAAPRLVLLYAPCTVNAGFLSPYASGGAATTPRLAAFAEEAVVFERHMTESGQSGPAYASIFTGRHADGHGVFHHPTPIATEIPILGEVFAEAGFHVEAWLAQVMASAELGYGRGADAVYDQVLTAEAPEFLAILSRLRDDEDARALVVASHTVTHAPYRFETLEPFCDRFPEACALRRDDPLRFDAAAGFYLNHHRELPYDFDDVVSRFGLRDEQVDYLGRVVELLYRANVARLDHHFGTLLDALDAHGLGDESLVVFTADHGETMLGAATAAEPPVLFPWTHGHQLSPQVLRVPLLVRASGIAPRRWTGVTRSTDLLPTLASLAGLPLHDRPLQDRPLHDRPPRDLPLEPWNGVDLAGAVRGTEAEPDLPAYSHTAMVSTLVLEESTSWHHFRRYYPREDPELMWAQLRKGDSLIQLRAQLRGELGEGGEVSLGPAFFGPPFLEGSAVDASGARDAALERLQVYRRRLIDAWHARSTSSDALDEARQIELLRSLGYVEP